MWVEVEGVETYIARSESAIRVELERGAETVWPDAMRIGARRQHEIVLDVSVAPVPQQGDSWVHLRVAYLLIIGNPSAPLRWVGTDQKVGCRGQAMNAGWNCPTGTREADPTCLMV